MSPGFGQLDVPHSPHLNPLGFPQHPLDSRSFLQVFRLARPYSGHSWLRRPTRPLPVSPAQHFPSARHAHQMRAVQGRHSCGRQGGREARQGHDIMQQSEGSADTCLHRGLADNVIRSAHFTLDPAWYETSHLPRLQLTPARQKSMTGKTLGHISLAASAEASSMYCIGRLSR